MVVLSGAIGRQLIVAVQWQPDTAQREICGCMMYRFRIIIIITPPQSECQALEGILFNQ